MDDTPAPFRLRIATRGSALALAQVRSIAAALHQVDPNMIVEPVIIETTGDAQRHAAIHTLAGYGHFTRKVDEALLDGRADCAVHSLKDLPIDPVPGLCIAAIPVRQNPDDAFITRDGCLLTALLEGAVIGTSSLRRAAQLMRLRPDCRIAQIRGNVDSRLKRLADGAWDAIVLAEAGLRRLDITVPRTLLDGEFLPAAGQGALAVSTRADNAALRAFLQCLHDADSARLVCAERAFLQTLGAGCHAAVGVRSTVGGAMLFLEGAVWSMDGSNEIRACVQGRSDEPSAVGNHLAEKILASGGRDVLASGLLTEECGE